jgi:glutamine synthetase
MNKLEYIWIDGVEPTSKLRSKTKVTEHFDGSISSCPHWGFDGSSTNQAPGDNSDCVLQPVKLYNNPLEKNGWLVLCEVWNTDGTPHSTNHRFKLEKLVSNHRYEDPWFGIEQEYTLFKDGKPLGWPKEGEPEPQGDYYCGRNEGEWIARKHMDACIDAGIKICGINSEVMLGQWEYQVGADSAIRISDDLWIARWLLEKICDRYDIKVSLDPKPIEGDWNGAGCHTNFSTKAMREPGGLDEIIKAADKFSTNHYEHIEVYGDGNERRLTGKYETCDIGRYYWGISDRGASVRIPWQVKIEKRGYLEDRRPAANCNPYLVCWRIIKTVCGD